MPRTYNGAKRQNGNAMEPVYFNLLAHAVDLSVFFAGFTAGAIAILAGIKLAAATTIPEEL